MCNPTNPIHINLKQMLDVLGKYDQPKIEEGHEETAILQELKTLRETMETATLEVANRFQHYGQKVDEYYSKFHPFNNSGEVSKDFRDFIEIVAHSVIIGNYSLISEWGVKYPLNNPSVLAYPDELGTYVAEFKDSIGKNWVNHQKKHGWPDEAKIYWKHLIDGWEHHISNPDV